MGEIGEEKEKARPLRPRSRALLSGFWEKSGALLWPRDGGGGGYQELLKKRPWTLGFCFAFVFASGFGQTFFLSIFQARWQSEFGLSPAQMGSLYGLATIASGLLLPFGGRWLDRTSAATAAKVVMCGLVVQLGSVQIKGFSGNGLTGTSLPVWP